MKNKRFAPYIIGGILLLLIAYTVSTYNGLVKKEEKVKLQWNEVQSAYQRRIDLIPNLVNVVKGQAEFEQSTLTQLAEARAKATSVSASADEITADKFNQQTQAQNELATAATRFATIPLILSRFFSINCNAGNLCIALPEFIYLFLTQVI